MKKHTNPVQKVWIFFENRKVLKPFRFSYKIAKTANSKTAITSNNTWIWRLKFGLRVQNESYSILSLIFLILKGNDFICIGLIFTNLNLKFNFIKCMTKIETFVGSRKVAHILKVWSLLITKIFISSRSVENSSVMSHSPVAPLVLTNSAQIFFPKL